MASAIDNWRDELKKYLRSIENISESALKSIKRDRIRNRLPFDNSFKESILDLTNARIANVYLNLMYEEILEDGQNLSNQNVNHQIDGNGLTNIERQLTLATNNSESIEQMPIILEQSNNQSFLLNNTANTVFAQDGNQMSDQIIISVPSNQSSSAASELEINRNAEQESHARSIQTELSRIGSVKVVRRTETPCEGVTVEPLIEFDSNEDTKKLNAAAKELDMQSTSTGAHRPKCNELFEQITNSNANEPETIDLASDQEDMVDNFKTNQNGDGQKQSDVCAGNTKNLEAFNCLPHSRKQPKTNYGIAQPSELNISIVTPQEIETDENMSQQFQNVPEEISISHHSTATTTSESAGNHRTGLATVIDGTYTLIVKDQIGHIASPDKNIESNSTKMVREKRHRCDYCEFSAEFKSKLTRHIRTHTGERPFKCNFCKKRFTQMHALNRHMKTHREMFAFQCSNCIQGFSDGNLWKSHKDRCQARGYECYLCKKIVYHKQDLVSHMRKHTGEKLRCSMCRKQFSSNKALTKHMRTHGKLFRFQCSNCRQGFSDEQLRKSHQSRCKAKQYECYLCSKKFNQYKCNLLEHMRHTHTGEKPFSCSDCPKQFCHKPHLIRHTKHVHKMRK